MTASPPAPRDRVSFPEIDAVSWEHPADRAALQSLRAIPGFDQVVRKLVAILGGERGIRLLFQGNAIRTGTTQYQTLHSLHVEVAATFHWPTVPELYVSQTPLFNAGAYGVDDPFIVVHTAALELLSEEELRVLLAHEMGHVVSGHAFYRTIAAILLSISFSALPILAGIALLPIRLAILEWSRKSELSADRAGLLGSQDIEGSQRLLMKMAGGMREGTLAHELDLDDFMAQAHEYLNTNEGFDIIYKIVNTLGLTHPLHTVRAAELQRWITSGDYERILRGEYTRRGKEAHDRPLKDDIGAASGYYAQEAKDTVANVVDAARKAAEKVGDAFRKGQSE